MAQQVKNLLALRETQEMISGLGRSPGGGKQQPTPVFLPGKSHGQRILADYSPKCQKESDITE